MDMTQVIYVSSAVRLFEEAELRELLKKARRRNEHAGVTGMLLYHDGNFMQVLEGPAESVAATEKRILRDPRHHHALVLMRRQIEVREFAGWSMGFLNVNELPPEEARSHSTFLRDSFSADATGANAGRARKVLQTFKKSVQRHVDPDTGGSP